VTEGSHATSWDGSRFETGVFLVSSLS